MTGETNLAILLHTMKPMLQPGDYVFCQVQRLDGIDIHDALLIFKETEAITIIVRQEVADRLQLPYSFIASWITLSVHSSLNAVGLTAAVATALSAGGISCNVVAAYFHDHIFIDRKDATQAMKVLHQLSE